MRSFFMAVWMTATWAACTGGEEEAACEAEAVQCDGDVLQECADGVWADVEDCAAEGLTCHEEHGHCMEGEHTSEHM
jgi:hypothetical protein